MERTQVLALALAILTTVMPVAALSPGGTARQVVRVRTQAVSMLIRVRDVVDFGVLPTNTNVCSDRPDVEIVTPGPHTLTVKVTDLDATRYGQQLNYTDMRGAIAELWLQKSSSDTSRDAGDVTLIASSSVPGLLPQTLDASTTGSYEVCVKTGTAAGVFDSVELTYELS